MISYINQHNEVVVEITSTPERWQLSHNLSDTLYHYLSQKSFYRNDLNLIISEKFNSKEYDQSGKVIVVCYSQFKDVEVIVSTVAENGKDSIEIVKTFNPTKEENKLRFSKDLLEYIENAQKFLKLPSKEALLKLCDNFQ